jgi:hypothetical protein
VLTRKDKLNKLNKTNILTVQCLAIVIQEVKPTAGAEPTNDGRLPERKLFQSNSPCQIQILPDYSISLHIQIEQVITRYE